MYRSWNKYSKKYSETSWLHLKQTGNIICIQIPTDTQPEIYLSRILVKYSLFQVNVRVYGARETNILPQRRLPSTKTARNLRDIRLTPRKWTELLWVITQLEVGILADVSGRPIGPIFRDQESDMGNNVIPSFKGPKQFLNEGIV